MPRSVRFLMLLLLGLGLLSLVATLAVQNTLRRWFAKDLGLRAQLAYSGARASLLDRWSRPEELRAVLTDLCRDERILAAAACDPSGAFVAQTAAYPPALGCTVTESAVQKSSTHVSRFALRAADRELGTILLLHDLSFMERRTGVARRFLLLCFTVLAVLASLFTVLLVSVTWREWSEELSKILRGGPHRKDFQPLLREVRELIERIASERHADAQAGDWTPQRLKHTLTRHLEGERVVLLANREPYIHEKKPEDRKSVV